MSIVIICISAAATSSAQDTIYQYTDIHGNLVISNAPQSRRNQILAEELDNERSALKEAENLLAQNAKSSNKEQKIPSSILEEAIAEHKKNIEILTTQLETNCQTTTFYRNNKCANFSNLKSQLLN